MRPARSWAAPASGVVSGWGERGQGQMTKLWRKTDEKKAKPVHVKRESRKNRMCYRAKIFASRAPRLPDRKRNGATVQHPQKRGRGLKKKKTFGRVGKVIVF